MSRHSARTTTRSRWVLGALVVGLPLSLLPATAGAQPTTAPTAARGTDRGWHGRPTPLPKVPVMTGSGGAVSSVDRDASQVGIDVLARGGNAADAAVATAAALGVTEPYSAGIGGGGFLVYYDAATKKVSTIDGRETAPATYDRPPSPSPTARRWTSTPSSTRACRSASPAHRPCGTRRFATTARCRSTPPSSRPSGSLPRASSSTRPSPTRRPPTPRASRCSPRRPGSSCATARRPRSARSSPTPTWPGPTARCAPRASSRCMPAGWVRRSSPSPAPRTRRAPRWQVAR